MSILWVDNDMPSFQKVYDRLCDELNIEGAQAYSVAEALAFLEEHKQTMTALILDALLPLGGEPYPPHSNEETAIAAADALFEMCTGRLVLQRHKELARKTAIVSIIRRERLVNLSFPTDVGLWIDKAEFTSERETELIAFVLKLRNSA